MTAGFDMAALDRQLEELFELDADTRAVRLQAIAASAPELAAVLRRLLGLAARVDTRELRAVGASPPFTGEEVGTGVGSCSTLAPFPLSWVRRDIPRHRRGPPNARASSAGRTEAGHSAAPPRTAERPRE